MTQQSTSISPKSEPGASFGLPRGGWRRDAAVCALLLTGFILPLVAYDWFDRRVWLLLALWAGVAIAGVALLRQPTIRTPLLATAAIVTMLFLGEAALSLVLDPPEPQRRAGGCGPRTTFDPYPRGYGRIQPFSVDCQKFVDGRLVYDAIYGFDDHYLRRTPGNPVGDTVLFFGCSVTFGTGLNDDETLPYFVSQQTGHRFNVRNFAFGGYGPHQMLRALENGLPPDVISGRVRRAFYVALPDHVHRAAGLVRRSRNAPRYVVGAKGEAEFAGASFAPPLPLHRPRAIRRSRLATWAWESAMDALRSRTGWQLDRFKAILRKANRLVQEMYGVPLTVVLWDDEDELSGAVRRTLHELGIEVIPISDILTPEQRARFTIPGDGHPTAEANRLIAARLVSMIE